jgi:hypothetical protein
MSDETEDPTYKFDADTFAGWALIEAITQHQKIVGERDDDKFFKPIPPGGVHRPVTVMLRINGVVVPFEKTLSFLSEQLDLRVTDAAGELIGARLSEISEKFQNEMTRLMRDMRNEMRKRLGLEPISDDDYHY